MQHFQRFTEAESLVAEVIGSEAVHALRSGVPLEQAISGQEVHPIKQITGRALQDSMYLTRLSWTSFSDQESRVVKDLVTAALLEAKEELPAHLARFSLPGSERDELAAFLKGNLPSYSHATLQIPAQLEPQRDKFLEGGRLQALVLAPQPGQGEAYFFYDATFSAPHRHFMHVVIDDSTTYSAMRIKGSQMSNALLDWVAAAEPASVIDVLSAVNAFSLHIRPGAALEKRFASGNEIKMPLQVVEQTQLSEWMSRYQLALPQDAGSPVSRATYDPAEVSVRPAENRSFFRE